MFVAIMEVSDVERVPQKNTKGMQHLMDTLRSLKVIFDKTEASHIISPMWNAFHKKNNIIKQGRLP